MKNQILAGTLIHHSDDMGSHYGFLLKYRRNSKCPCVLFTHDKSWAKRTRLAKKDEEYNYFAFNKKADKTQKLYLAPVIRDPRDMTAFNLFLSSGKLSELYAEFYPTK